MENIYFTFGTDPRFPFGQNDYVVVRCDDIDTACDLFNAVHPKRPGSNAVNCAFIYHEDVWERHCKQHYKGREPVETITVNRAGA